MERSKADAGGTGNLFIDNLERESRDQLLSRCTQVALKKDEVIYRAGEPVEKIIFPINSAVSVVTELADGSTLETGLIGREGMTGLPVALGTKAAIERAYVQLAGPALCVAADDFGACLAPKPTLLSSSLHYAQATISATAQFAACNRAHTISERCARWMLMAHDRVRGDVIALTHEFLGIMLGARRPGVTVAASGLQRAGFIEYSHGKLTVLSRGGLESASCECYLTVEQIFKGVMGYSIRKSA